MLDRPQSPILSISSSYRQRNGFVGAHAQNRPLEGKVRRPAAPVTDLSGYDAAADRPGHALGADLHARDAPGGERGRDEGRLLGREAARATGAAPRGAVAPVHYECAFLSPRPSWPRVSS